MPPEVPYCRTLVTPLLRSSSPPLAEAKLPVLYRHHKHRQRAKKMNFAKKRIVPFLVLILTTISILRLLLIMVTTYSPSSPPFTAFSPTLQAGQTPLNASLTPSTNRWRIHPNLTVIKEKEFQLLANLVADRAPCNLLVFGLEPEYLSLSSINEGGNTVFLEDNPDKILNTPDTDSNTTRIYKVEYNVPAKEAYKLLKQARKNSACFNISGYLNVSKCRLALRDLPQEVYERSWEVVVVDGPRGDSPEAPGRMSAIYTAAVLARNRNVTNVVVHDVDRMIERWFSWEFLCDENLVSSKGKLWNFRISGQLNSSVFCPSTPVVLV